MFSLQTSDPKSGAPVLSTAKGRVRCSPPSSRAPSPPHYRVTNTRHSSSAQGQGPSILSPGPSSSQTGLIQTPFPDLLFNSRWLVTLIAMPYGDVPHPLCHPPYFCP